MKWYRPIEADYPALIVIWESAVRATHHFLTEKDIAIYKALILSEYFYQLDLYCSKVGDTITGFLGLTKDTVQMLFVDPTYHGSGIGTELLQFAVQDKGCVKVDVNEQNKNAVGFYHSMGFVIQERFEEDAAGRPFPILAMQLKK